MQLRSRTFGISRWTIIWMHQLPHPICLCTLSNWNPLLLWNCQERWKGLGSSFFIFLKMTQASYIPISIIRIFYIFFCIKDRPIFLTCILYHIIIISWIAFTCLLEIDSPGLVTLVVLVAVEIHLSILFAYLLIGDSSWFRFLHKMEGLILINLLRYTSL